MPPLTPTDPLGRTRSRPSRSLAGRSGSIDFSGNAAPVDQQAGLTFDNSGGLLCSNNYSVEMVLEFLQADNTWRRIVDVQDRQSDNGFYADPGEPLACLSPPRAAATSSRPGEFHHVVLTVADTGTVAAYLDGGPAIHGLDGCHEHQ